MEILSIIKTELKNEADAIYEKINSVDDNYNKAVEILFNCKGKVIVTGMGKTGLIGRKISATLASTGTTSIFLHAAEGIHGDLGVVATSDVVIAISYTGNSSELVSILPYFRHYNIPIIAITGNNSSKLAKNSQVVLNCSVSKEIEQFGIVPTASTTLTLAIGDALSVALMKMKNFRITDFAKVHPGGTIGKKLLLKVKDLMHDKEKNPIVKLDTKMQEVIFEITTKKLGCTNVLSNENKLVGIITDGDLRRFLSNKDFTLESSAKDFMSKNPKTITEGVLAVDTLRLMEKYKITVLSVIDDEGYSKGILHMHDLIEAGLGINVENIKS